VGCFVGLDEGTGVGRRDGDNEGDDVIPGKDGIFVGEDVSVEGS
jgi:hypothetical protein